MTLIAEAYVHLRPFDESEESLREAAIVIQNQSRMIAGKIYGPSVDIGVRLEEGSLKTWVVVAGVIYAILDPVYNAIANYPSFKAGIKELYIDAKHFGHEISRVVTSETGASRHQIYRIERRTKIVGKIDRLIARIERIRRNGWRLGPREQADELAKINERLQAILSELDDARDREILLSVMSDAGIPQLPTPSRTYSDRALMLRREGDEVDWDHVPMTEGPAVAMGGPKVRWRTTILLKDGREISLRPGQREVGR